MVFRSGGCWPSRCDIAAVVSRHTNLRDTIIISADCRLVYIVSWSKLTRVKDTNSSDSAVRMLLCDVVRATTRSVQRLRRQKSCHTSRSHAFTRFLVAVLRHDKLGNFIQRDRGQTWSRYGPKMCIKHSSE